MSRSDDDPINLLCSAADGIAYTFGSQGGLITFTFGENERTDTRQDALAFGFSTLQRDGVIVRVMSGNSNDYIELKLVSSGSRLQSLFDSYIYKIIQNIYYMMLVYIYIICIFIYNDIYTWIYIYIHIFSVQLFRQLTLCVKYQNKDQVGKRLGNVGVM